MVYEGIQPGIYGPWAKAALQVNGISGSSHKKFAPLDAFDCFTAYCTFKSEMASRQPLPDTIIDEEVDKIAYAVINATDLTPA